MAYNSETDKIDKKAVDGLNGTYNSLAYRVHEIERHHHGNERWMGVAATPSGETHAADEIGPGVGPFVIDAGNETWGDWTLILGSDDTPVDDGNAYFDPHLITITYTERAALYFVQASRGETGDAGIAAGSYTESVYDSTAVGEKQGDTTLMQSRRLPAGSKVWARCLAIGENTAEIRFFLGLHEYEN